MNDNFEDFGSFDPTGEPSSSYGRSPVPPPVEPTNGYGMNGESLRATKRGEILPSEEFPEKGLREIKSQTSIINRIRLAHETGNHERELMRSAMGTFVEATKLQGVAQLEALRETLKTTGELIQRREGERRFESQKEVEARMFESLDDGLDRIQHSNQRPELKQIQVDRLMQAMKKFLDSQVG